MFALPLEAGFPSKPPPPNMSPDRSRSRSRSPPRSVALEEKEKEASQISEKTKTKTSQLSQLVVLQAANGSYALSAQLLNITGVSMEDVDKVLVFASSSASASFLKTTVTSSSDVLRTLFATALALAFLEMCLADIKEDWEMMANKSKRWIMKQQQEKAQGGGGAAAAAESGWMMMIVGLASQFLKEKRKDAPGI